MVRKVVGNYSGHFHASCIERGGFEKGRPLKSLSRGSRFRVFLEALEFAVFERGGGSREIITRSCGFHGSPIFQ